MMKIVTMMKIIVFDSLKYHTLTIQYDGARGVIFEYCLVGSLVFDEFRANSFFAVLMSKAKPIINLTEPAAEVIDADDQ